MEIYQPAYLFTQIRMGKLLAARPDHHQCSQHDRLWSRLSGADVRCCQYFFGAMMRNPSVTHAFDMDQRMVGLSFIAGSGYSTVTGPPNGNIAPPGLLHAVSVQQSGCSVDR